MASVNKVILVGNLGADPEMRYAPSGDAVANFRLATTDKFREKASGEMKEVAEWHSLVAFGRIGEIAGEFLKKGSSVYIEGKLQTRSYQKDGQTHYRTEVRVIELKMLGGGNGGRGDDKAPPRSSEPASNRGGRPASRRAPDPSLDEMSDAIPF